jgi:hypothetical protein
MLNSAGQVLGEEPAAIANEIRFAIPTNGGTIDYVARHAGIRGRAEDIVQKLVKYKEQNRPIRTNLVRSLVFEGHQETPTGALVPFRRVGFAAAVAGIGNRFFDKYYKARIPGPKVIAHISSRLALGTLLGALPFSGLFPRRWIEYAEETTRPLQAVMVVDGKELPYRDFSVINLGAFKINLGGVFKIFTYADHESMHVMAGETTPLAMVRNLPRMVTGRRLHDTRLHDAPGKVVHIRATGDELLRPNIDGEFVHDIREMTVRLGPRFRIPQIEAKRYYPVVPRRDRAANARRKGFWSLEAWRERRLTRKRGCR